MPIPPPEYRPGQPERIDNTAAEYRAAVDQLILAALEGDPDA